MIQQALFPDFVFEASWEVCNKVGGIYTVLSSRAKTLCENWPITFVLSVLICKKKIRYLLKRKSCFQNGKKL